MSVPALRTLGSVDVPVADVAVYALATRLLVSTEGENVKLAVLARLKILVWLTPGIHRDLVEVASGPPVTDRGIGWLVDQGLQSLVSRGILEVIQPVEVQSAFYRPDILLGAIDLGVIDAAYHVRCHEGGQYSEDHDDYHDLDERESAFAGPLSICDTVPGFHSCTVTHCHVRTVPSAELRISAVMISGLLAGQGPEDGRHGIGRDLVFFAVIAGLVLGLEAGGDNLRMLLRFDREPIQAGQYWRLLTAHLVHLGWRHALMNLVALGLIIIGFRPLMSWRRWGIVAIASVAAIDFGLWFSTPPVIWYVGLSGVLHGLVVAAALALVRLAPRTGAAILIAVAVKLAWELFRGALPFTAELAGGDVIVEAHLWGAIGGAAAGLLLAGLRPVPTPL